MGKPNPFICLEPPVVNAGFEPELSYIAGIYQEIFDELNVFDFTAYGIQEAIRIMKESFVLFNDAPYFGNLRLVYPSPWPTITGTQSLQFYIRNDQAEAVFPDFSGQQVGVAFDLIDGVVDGWAVGYSGAPATSSNYTTPLYQIEKDVIRALNIYEQSGAAFFPDYYSLVDGLAVSALARCQNWEYNQTVGYPLRNPIPTDPYQPNERIVFPLLSKEQKYVLVLLGKIVKYAMSDPAPDFSEVTDYADALSLPEGWSVVHPYNSSGEVEFSFMDSEDVYGFKLVGYYVSDAWTWQRWYTGTNVGPPADFLVVFSGDPLPIEPNAGKSYQAFWFDIEDICFEEQTNETPQFYGLPAKSGDQIRFNVLPESGNTTGLTECLVGLFDSENVFIQEIGTAELPNASICAGATQMQATATIPSVANGCYKIGLYVYTYASELMLLSLSQLIHVDNEEGFSQVLEYAGNDGTVTEGFEYYGDWSQRIRIGLREGAPQAVINDSTYRQSNGVTRRPANKSDLKLSLQTNYIDKPTQLAMFGATRHPVFVLAGQSLFIDGDVSTNHSKDFSTESSYFELAFMEFDALVQGFQPSNNACLGC